MERDILTKLDAAHLTVAGTLYPPDMAGIETLVLLAPAEPGFWPAFQSSPEFLDKAPDPMDRWSSRVIGQLASDMGAQPFFPFGGPPYHPFIQWALSTGRIWQSPVNLLVADTAGMFISFRGALGFARRLEFGVTPTEPPCTTCRDQPCRTACPTGALTPRGYDVPKCKTYLETKAGQTCLTGGCLVRRSCPISQNYDRMPEQSAFHMRSFL